MNIFILADTIDEIVKAMFDRHVVKMILETCQLLCTPHHILDPEEDNSDLYKPTHKNHPCSVWVRESIGNYLWLHRLFVAMLDEYTFRYDKIHACARFVEALSTPPISTPTKRRTPFAQAMPEKYRVEGNAVSAYRAYCIGEKQRLAKWTRRDPPIWWKN
jgi:hypothetical protein